MDIEKIGLIAQEISFAFEDTFHEENKRKLFESFFQKYLALVDFGPTQIPYDAMLLLGRKFPEEFNRMVQEMKDASLISA